MNDEVKLLKTREVNNDVLMMTLTGELDYGSLIEVRDDAYQFIEKEPRNVIVDLRALNFIDSNGLGFLLSVHKRVREKGRSIALVSTSAHIDKLLRMSGLNTIIEVFPDDEKALTHFS